MNVHMNVPATTVLLRLTNIYFIFVMSVVILTTCLRLDAKAEYENNTINEEELINRFIDSRGYKNCIILTPANVNQFWIDKSVLSVDGIIKITLKKESVPLKIQLANVNESMDCRIDIITETDSLSFQIKNSDLRTISESNKEDDFIHYHVLSSIFHLEDLQSFSFNIVLHSDSVLLASIKRIIFSFSRNPDNSFHDSPGFDVLLDKINSNGIDIPDKDIKYYISENKDVIYFRIPHNMFDYRFFYHVDPLNLEDLAPNRIQYKFNNYDFSPNDRKNKKVIPKPFSANNQYEIIQCDLPNYPFSQIKIGQYQGKIKFWTLIFKNNVYTTE